jgi:N4-gp56 family major capsid protein
MQIYYDKVFLDRAMNELRYDFGAQKRAIPKNSGKTVYFNRFSQLALVTSNLTEGVDPTVVDMTSTQVTGSVAEYGAYTIVSSLFDLTSLDANLKEHVEVLGQNAGESIDQLIATALKTGATIQLAGAKSNITAVAATDVLSGAEIRKAVRTLKNNKAKRFPEGMFRGILDPSQAYDLFGNTDWLNSRIYTDASDLKKGIIGDLHGVRWVECNTAVTTSSTVTVHHAFVFGENSYGIVDIASSASPKIIVKTPGTEDIGNPLNLRSTIGWKVTFLPLVLNANWIVQIETGVTA